MGASFLQQLALDHAKYYALQLRETTFPDPRGIQNEKSLLVRTTARQLAHT